MARKSGSTPAPKPLPGPVEIVAAAGDARPLNPAALGALARLALRLAREEMSRERAAAIGGK